MSRVSGAAHSVSRPAGARAPPTREEEKAAEGTTSHPNLRP